MENTVKEKYIEIVTLLFSPDYPLFYFYFFILLLPSVLYLISEKSYFFSNSEQNISRKRVSKILLISLLLLFFTLGAGSYHQIQFAIRAYLMHAINLYLLSVLSVKFQWLRKRKIIYWALLVLFFYMQSFYLANSVYYDFILHHDYGRIKTGFVEFLTFLFLFPICVLIYFLFYFLKQFKTNIYKKYFGNEI